jgi:hypothetical protein
MLSSCRKTMSVISAPKVADGQAGQDRDRMDEVFVEDAEHEVDHEDCDREASNPGLGASW